MKRIKYITRILLAATLLLPLHSCNDWLEVEIKTNQTTDNFYSTPSELEQALLGIYNGLLPLAEYSWIMSELRSDNVWTEPMVGIQRDYVDIGTFNSNIITISTLNAAWTDLYEIIGRTNTFLQKIEEVDFNYTKEVDVKASFKAEACLLRALAYFELVRYFGSVPIVLQPQSISEAMSTPQSDAAKVYEQAIIPDLLYAVEHLDVTAYNYQGTARAAERANKIVAKSLLGRVYLTMSGYPLYDYAKAQLAAEQLEWVVDYAESKNAYWAKTATEWQHIWISDNDNKYHIFEIQYIAEANYGNTMVWYSVPKAPSSYVSISMSGYKVTCARELLDMYATDANRDGKADDGRYTATVDTTQYTTYNNGLTYERWYTGEAFFTKFFEHKMKRAKLGYSDIDAQIVTRTYFPLNYPLIRLEDVMLMYAEVVGATDKGIRLVNKIRTRAGLSELTVTEKQNFQYMVDTERRRELAGEGIRWHDLVRHDTYRSALKNKFRSYGSDKNGVITSPSTYALGDRVIEGTHLYPIPDIQMKIKEGLYQQNSAYK